MDPNMLVHGDNNIEGDYNGFGYCLPRLSHGQWLWCCQVHSYCSKDKNQCDIVCIAKS